MVDGEHRVAILANREIEVGEELFYGERSERSVCSTWRAGWHGRARLSASAPHPTPRTPPAHPPLDQIIDTRSGWRQSGRWRRGSSSSSSSSRRRRGGRRRRARGGAGGARAGASERAGDAQVDQGGEGECTSVRASVCEQSAREGGAWRNSRRGRHACARASWAGAPPAAASLVCLSTRVRASASSTPPPQSGPARPLDCPRRERA